MPWSYPDAVEFVDREHDMPHTHEPANRQVAVCLPFRAAHGIDQQDSHVGGRCCHGHVAGVLLVAGSVGEDGATPTGQHEVAVGHVDGDALFTFGFQAVGDQAVIDLAQRDGGTGPTGEPADFQLVLRDRAGLASNRPSSVLLPSSTGTADDNWIRAFIRSTLRLLALHGLGSFAVDEAPCLVRTDGSPDVADDVVHVGCPALDRPDSG